ncbi:hypothetical protein BDN67DRAFT_984037 [Paxillus ammoniavirescens]|nr:hypothetical protein BDN67DRAFT_984037 [Paxillus ammoniavirescens]
MSRFNYQDDSHQGFQPECNWQWGLGLTNTTGERVPTNVLSYDQSSSYHKAHVRPSSTHVHGSAMTTPHPPCPAVPPTAKASQCANTLDQILSAPAASDQWGTLRGQIDHQPGPHGQFNTVSQPIFHLSATPSPHDQHRDPISSSSEDPYHRGILQI